MRFNPLTNVKVATIAAAVLLIIISWYGFYLLGTKGCAGSVATDTVEELQDDRSKADELSVETSAQIKQLVSTIAQLRGERSESNIDDCMLPDDSKRLRKDALSSAFSATN